jgi:MerR family transcriptional regulator/heat shock protein HspR
VTTERSGSDSGRDDQGVYGISVAAELAGTGVQNLRLYERKGLLRPSRSAGGTRLYSANDIHRLRRIIDLLAAGVNLAGIAMVLDLQDDNTRMISQIHRRATTPRRRPSTSDESAH